jgi:putative intracellular protease/amidase
MDINCLLFNDFETLDLFGPVEVFGKVEECCLKYFSMNGGKIVNKDNIQITTENINKIEKHDVVLIPGGKGTRALVDDNEFIQGSSKNSQFMICHPKGENSLIREVLKTFLL